MEAGFEIDSLIAEKIFGWKLDDESALVWLLPDGSRRGALPHYSTDIADAWQVIEHMNDRGWSPTVFCEFQWWIANFFTDIAGSFEASAETAPLAICLAALRAMG